MVIYLLPGFSNDMIESLFRNFKETKGLILAFYGVGNAPSNETFYQFLNRAITQYDTQIVVTTQCLHGHVDITIYQAGNFFVKLGLINAGDMTMESSVAKLAVLMGSGYRGNDLKQLFEKDLRGELTSLDEIHNRIVDYRKTHKKIIRQALLKNSKSVDHRDDPSYGHSNIVIDHKPIFIKSKMLSGHEKLFAPLSKNELIAIENSKNSISENAIIQKDNFINNINIHQKHRH